MLLFLLSIFFNFLHFLDNQWVVGCSKCYGLEPFLQRLEDDEEGRDDEEEAEGADAHAAASHFWRMGSMATLV